MNANESKIVEISEVKHNFNLNVFEGPLDVLLYLARTSQIEIAEISLNALIDQYISYIESVQDQGINVASEYIEMAAELIRLKSKTLLPNNEFEELEELLDGTYTRDQLIAKLIEYKKYKDVALELEGLHESRPQTYYKSQSKMSEFRNKNFQSSLDMDRLKLAMQAVLIQQESTVTETKMIEATELDVQSKIDHLKTIKKQTTFTSIIKELDRLDRVAFFLGLLESIKLGFVHVGLDGDEILVKPGAVKDE